MPPEIINNNPTTNDTVINETFHFNPVQTISSGTVHAALKAYSENFDLALKLESNLPIVLDTNILLRFYGMSIKERQKLMQFFNKYFDRIYITQQIEQEYLKNRLAVIQTDVFEPQKKVVEDFLKLRLDVGNKLKEYRSKRKNLLQHDYPDLWNALINIEDVINQKLFDSPYYEKVSQKAKQDLESYKNIEFSDELLEVVSKFKVTSKLSKQEVDYLKSRFEVLNKEFAEAAQNEKWRFAIPGCGDKKNDASGDYIIFNELLKFMRIMNSHCIFLTNDTTKGDWLTSAGGIHCHYIEQSFNLTNSIVFIIKADKALSNISFENVNNIQFEIIKATYGTTLDKQYDVTDIIKDKIENNRIQIKVTNQLAGDPDPGIGKILTIDYRIQGEIFTKRFEENQEAIIQFN